MNSKERFFAFKISLIMSIRMLGLFMILPIFSVYAYDYNNSTPYLIGVAIGAYGLTQALLQIPFGYLSDQFGRKPLLIIGLIIFFIGSIVAANAHDIITIIIARAIQGAGAVSAVLMAFLADFVSPNQRSKANAFVGMQIGAAFMLSLLLGPLIATNFGIDGLFWIISALSVMAFMLVLSLPNIKPNAQYNFSMDNVKVIFSAKLVKLDISVFALHLVLTCVFIVIPVLLSKNNIVNIANSWHMYLPVIVLSFIVMLPMIILAEKYKKTKILLVATIAILLTSQILLYFVNIDEQEFIILNYGTFFTLLTLFFIAFNALEALLPSMIAKTSTPDKRGLAMSMFSTAQFLGAFSGGIFGGLMYSTFGINSVFLLTAIIIAIWLLIMLII